MSGNDRANVPLIGGDLRADSNNNNSLEYDEVGAFRLARALNAMRNGRSESGAAADVLMNPTQTPCNVISLNGSWYLQLTPRGPHPLIEIRGPMRIEAAPPKLRISGDIYVNMPGPSNGLVEMLRPIPEMSQLFGKNWYPHMLPEQYSWYFRSIGATYNAGKLVFNFERRMWNPITKEFINDLSVGQGNGFIELNCFNENILTHPLLPQPTLRLSGIAQVGSETYDVVATKTSPFYRGCLFEVDLMTTRSFPDSATTFDGAIITFAGIYLTAGIDCAVKIDQTNLPDDIELTSAALQTALTDNRSKPINNAWRLWVLIGSIQGDLAGLMFDEIDPAREGLVLFFDPKLGNGSLLADSARNKRLGEVPPAFLRTLLHEVGHAFNLLHPGEDIHAVPPGVTIMNQTGVVMAFATTTNRFPDNVAFAFDEHCRTSLIHSPDPQVAPGWKPFRWGMATFQAGFPNLLMLWDSYEPSLYQLIWFWN